MSTFRIKVRLLHGAAAGNELSVNVPASLFNRVLELDEQGLLQVLTCRYAQ